MSVTVFALHYFSYQSNDGAFMNVTRKRPRLNPKWIDPQAKRIIDQLQASFPQSYLVGGCVRDLLIGIQPKDYDIATEARPQEVRKLISRAHIIGKRFRLVLVRRGAEQYEIATFRRSVSQAEAEASDIEGDNFFGSPEQDAFRRDFTINAMFYDPINDEILDHCQGLDDIRNGIIRMIGEPNERLVEDPIRILRALRLAHKIDFTLEVSLRQAMTEQAHLLESAVLPRKREEYLKLLRLRTPSLAFLEAEDLGLLAPALPSLHRLFQDPEARQRFLIYLDQARLEQSHEAKPDQCFLGLLHAYLRAQDDLQDRDLQEALESLRPLAQEELGVFRGEFEFICRSLTMAQQMQETEKFRRRGKKRQLGFASQDCFEMSLAIAKRDFLVSPSELKYWTQLHLEAEKESLN